jgi:hypothetical protein
VIGFPLLLIPFAIFNMVAFLIQMDWATKLYRLPLKSGVIWEPTAGDAFIVFTLLMLMFEFIKSMRHGKSFVEHFLSLLLACGAAAEFVMVDPAKVMPGSASTPAAASVIVTLIAICFVDLFAGFAASLRRARRAVVIKEPVVPARAEPVRETVRIEPARPEPARTEPGNPFVRVEPPPPVELSGRTEPVIDVAPVQKVGS